MVIILSKGSNVTLSPETLPPIKVSTTSNLHTLDLDDNELVDAEEVEGGHLMGGMMIFALVLTGLFCLCLCAAICFCIDTKRKSKLRKMSMKNEWNAVQTNNINNNVDPKYDVMQSKIMENEENEQNNQSKESSEKIERQITPYMPSDGASIKLQRILMTPIKIIKSPKLKSPKLFISKSPKLSIKLSKSPKSPKRLKVPENDDDDDSEEDDDDILNIHRNASNDIRTLEQYEELENEDTTFREDTLTIDINDQSVTKSNSVQNLIQIFDPHQ